MLCEAEFIEADVTGGIRVIDPHVTQRVDVRCWLVFGSGVVRCCHWCSDL